MTTQPQNVTTLAKQITPANDGSIRGLVEQVSYFVVVLQTVIFFLLWAMALLGNILVVLVIRRSRRMQSTTNYFVASIAFSDLTLILLSAPFVCVQVMTQNWTAGHVLCRLVRFVQFFSTSSTSFVLVAICIDRFYTILHPLSFKIKRSTAKRMIAIAWVISILISGLCLYFFDQVVVTNVNNSDQTRYVCPTFIPASQWSGKLYAVLCVVSQYVCPFVAILVGYSRIFCHIWYIRNQVRHRGSSIILVARTKVKMVKMLMIVSCGTFLLYLPYYATQIIYCFMYQAYLSSDVFVSAYWLICSSAAVKPAIYAWGNGNFWRGCREVLCMSAMRCYRKNAYIVTNASSVGKRNYVGVLDLSKEQISLSIDSPPEPFDLILHDEKVSWPGNGSLPSTSM